jgi:hypothetical protein
MAKPNITRFSSFKTWLANFNLLVDSVGDLSTLNTNAKSSTVDAVNEVNGDIGNVSSLTTTNKTSVVGAVNALNAEKAKLAGDASQSFAVKALTVAWGVTNTGAGAVATLGAELTTNGSFAGSADGWTLGTNWAYGSNNIVLTNSGSSGTVSQNISVTSGLRYLVSWTQTNSIDQNCHITPSIGSVNGTKCAQGTGASTMSQIITAGATGSLPLAFTVSDITNTGTVTISNVSVKQITGYSAHETIKFNSSDAKPTEIRHTWDGANQPSLAIGWTAGQCTTTGYNNVLLGASAGQFNTTGFANSFVGANAGYSNTTGYNNSFMGLNSGYSNTTGFANSFMGLNSGYSNTTGYNNSFIGMYAGYSNTTGYDNSFVGLHAGNSNTTGNYNSFVGMNAGYYNTTGNYNSFIGLQAGYFNTTGYNNSFVGASAGTNNTTGNYNSFMGFRAGYSNTTGNYNSFVGMNAGYSNTTGYNNTSVGFQAGYGTGSNANVDGYNNTFIGYQAVGASSSSNNTITLGNSDITTLRCQVTSITSLSDRRDKDNIEPLPNGLDFINTLNPVKFTWNMRDGAKIGVPDCGFIAQDLKAAQENAGAKDWLNLVLEDNPDKLEITPGRLIPVLVKAIQELSAQVDALKSQLENK